MFCISVVVLNDYASALLVTFGSMLLNFALMSSILARERQFLAYVFYIAFFILQPLFFFLVAVLFKDLTMHMCRGTTIFTGGAYSLLFSFNLIPFIGYLFSCVHANSLKKNGRDWYSVYKEFVDTEDLSFMLISLAAVNAMVWYVAFLGNFVGYVLRIVRGVFSFTPCLAGYYGTRSKLSFLVWMGLLVSGILFGLVTGSRGYAFWPVLLYGLGYFLNAGKLKKKMLVIAGIIVFPTAMTLIGFIGDLRAEVGRNALSDVNISEVLSRVPEVWRNSRSKTEDGYRMERTTLYMGLERLVDWTMVFVPNMTPRVVPYRGYHDYDDELKGIMAFGGSDLNTTFGNLYPTQLYARPYGFNVHLSVSASGRLKSFTVPFSVLADSWSRFGILSSVVQITAMIGFFNFMEKMIRKLFIRHRLILIFSIMFLSGIALRFAPVYNLTRSMRQTVFHMVVVLSVTMALTVLNNIIIGEQSRNLAMKQLKKRVSSPRIPS